MASVSSKPAKRRTAVARPERNPYPIVLVHGWTGWGRDELGGYKYWGGIEDLQEHLNNVGYETHTVAVGPLSSNWDRACELYAYLKGGRVDYGGAHAAKYGHERYGRFYPGILQDWGKTTGSHKKIHLLAHSMGGQTSRQLIEFLYTGAPEEVDYSKNLGETPHELFQGGKTDWVSSLTTLSTPHNGTTLANFAEITPIIRQLVVGLIELSGQTDMDVVYDFKLDQWGIGRHEDENLLDLLERILASPLLTTQDFSPYDLSPEGARELNSKTPAKENIFYFSWATAATTRLRYKKEQVAAWHMLPLFRACAAAMGSCTTACMWRTDDPVPLDSSWFENDGIVNTRSMRGPTIGSTDKIVAWNGAPQIGQWNYMGLKNGWDHFDIVGMNETWLFPLSALPEKINVFYEKIAELLKRLPA